jgi:exopolysaccharide biosynthesis polyprenyl glycosylphosphotransferase
MTSPSGEMRDEMLVEPSDGAAARVGEALLEHGRWHVPMRHRGLLLRRSLAVADLFGLVVAFALTQPGLPQTGLRESILFALSLPLWLLLMKLHGLYEGDEERADHSTVDEITRVFQALTIGTWVSFVVLKATGVFELSLDRFVLFWILAIVGITLARAGTRALCRRTLSYIQNAVIVGTGPVGRLVARKLLAHPEYGINLVGFVDSAPLTSAGAVGGLPVLGSPQRIHEIVTEHEVERVIVAFTPDSHEDTLDVVRAVRDLDVKVDIVPRLFEVIGTNSTVHMLEGVPLVGLPPLRLSPSARMLKRSFDLVSASIGLVLLAPLFVATAIAIKLDSRGPIFFSQLRRGELEGTFRIYKFRTMSEDAEQQKASIEHLNMHLDEDSRMFKAPADPRITRVGRFLRRWSIDELPQLINVLVGEMSLVGPRPLILEEDRHVERWARKRLELKPGITGLWQVLGRSDIPFEDMTKLDYLYVTSWSLKEDLRLILLTVPALLRERRAY